MPTPVGPRSSLARDGTVANMNWADFTKQFQNVYTGSGMDSSQGGGEGSGLAGTGAGNAYGTANIGQLGGPIARWTNNGQDVYRQLLPDGTENDYTQGDGGALVSANNTTNNDSWWDSTGIPLLVSAGFGSAIGLAGSLGVGVDAAGNAVGAGTAGLSGSGVAAGEAPVNVASGTLGYAPYEEGGQLLNVAAPAAENAAQDVATQPGLWDSLTNGLSNLSQQYGSLDPLTRLGIGTAGSAGLSALSGGSGSSDSSSGGSFLNALTGGNGTTGIGGSPADYGVGTFGSNIVTGLSGSGAGDNSWSSLINGLGGTGGINYNGVGSLDSPGTSSGNWLSNLLSGSGINGGQLASGLGGIASAALGYKTAQDGIAAQTAAANANNALANKIFDTNTALAKPFVDGGTSAFNQQSNLNGLNGGAAQTAAMGQFHTDPGYQFAFDQGQRAVQSSAAASGGLYSGRAAKDLTTFGQGQADQQYNNYYGRLSGQAQIGQAAAAGQAAQGNNLVQNVSSNNNAIGNAQTAGGVAGSNAITGGINTALGQNSNNQLLQLLLKNQNSNGYY